MTLWFITCNDDNTLERWSSIKLNIKPEKNWSPEAILTISIKNGEATMIGLFRGNLQSSFEFLTKEEFFMFLDGE